MDNIFVRLFAAILVAIVIVVLVPHELDWLLALVAGLAVFFAAPGVGRAR